MVQAYQNRTFHWNEGRRSGSRGPSGGGGPGRGFKERSPYPGRTLTSQKPDMFSTYVILYAAYTGRCMQHTSCNALGRVGPLFSGTDVPLGSSAGKDGPIRPRVEGRTRGAALKTAARLTAATHCYWTPVCGIRAPTHSPAPRRGAGSCVGRCLYLEPVPSLRRGWRPALAPHRSSGRLAPPLGLRRSVPSVRCGRDNPTRLRRATRSPLLLGPEQARASAWGLQPSVLGTVGARLRVGEVEADGAFSSARCARLGARTTSAKPLA